MLEILNGRDKFYQWDVNQKLIVDDTIIAVQYDNGTGDALVCGVYEYEGQYVADVPNIMLQTYWAIKCYAYCGECVRAEKVYEVEKRSRPDDYIYTETETLRYSTLFDMLTETNEDVAAIEDKHNEDIAALTLKHNNDKALLKQDIAINAAAIEHIKTISIPDIYDLLNEQNNSINGLVEQTETQQTEIDNNYHKIRTLETNTDIKVNNIYKRIDANTNTITNHENRISTLENNPTGGGTGTAADVDWAENNPDSPAYIKNRTHWEEWCETEVMPLTVIDTIMEEDGLLVAGYQPLLEGIEGNKEYTITYNGVEYKSKCVNGEELGMGGIYLLGNYPLMMGGESTGEPYAILITTVDTYEEMGMGVIIYMLDGATELTLGIKYEGFVIHKLDDKYINIKQPNWKAKQGEPGYIMNRTHYVEHWGEYELKLAEVNGLVSFEIKPGVMAYKVSEVVLPYVAIKQAKFNFYKDSMGYGTRYAEINANDGYAWGDVPDWGGVFSCYQTNWTNEQLGLNVPENGTYLYITGDYTRVNVNATDVYYKLNTNYIDLSNYYTKSEVDTKVMPIINSLGNTSLKGVSDTGAIDIKGYTDIQVDIALQGQRITDTIKVKMYDINNTFICDMAIAENLDTSDVVSIQAYYRTSGLLNIDVEVGNNALLRDIKRYVWRRTTGVSKLGTIQIYTANGAVFGDMAVITIMGGKA